MSSVPILCTRCLKLKDRKEYSKAQLKKKSGHVCLSCAMNAAQNSSVEKAKEKVVLPAEKPLPSRLFKPLSGPEGDKADKMTCLTMHQPWASLLVYGIKRAEGRGWNTDFRGRLWIHAGITLWNWIIISCETANTWPNCSVWSKLPGNL